MLQIQIRCPSCHKNGIIEIDESALKNVTRGLLAINIETHTICEHSFITYVDRNLKIRDYFIADFQFEIPQSVSIEKLKEAKLPESETINIDLIKLNLPATLITYIIKSILSKKKVLILLEEEFLYSQVINFFKYITQGAFNVNISIISNEDYNQNSKNYKDFMIFEGIDIIRNINKDINPKKLAIEKLIVHNFFSEVDTNSSLILLRNDIQKAYTLSKSIVGIINNLKPDEKINIIKISKEIENSYNIKLSSIYLDFLIEIVKNYFEINIPNISQSFLNSI